MLWLDHDQPFSPQDPCALFLAILTYMKISVSSKKQCQKYANSGLCVIIISGWKRKPQKQQVQNKMNNFVGRQTAGDTTEHVASEAAQLM